MFPSSFRVFVATQPIDLRHNWLFFGSDQGGRTLATLASFTATCGLFKLNPWLWLRDALPRLPLTPTDRRGELLPTPSAAPQ